MGVVEYDIHNYTIDKLPKDTRWFGFIEELDKIALIGTINDDTDWVISNAIYFIGNLGNFHSQPEKGNEVLIRVMEIYPYLSKQYLEVARKIDEKYNSKDYNGKTVNYEEIKRE